MNLLRVSLLILGITGMTVGNIGGADTKDAKEPSDAVKALAKKLQSNNQAERIKAANDLEKLGAEAKPALFELVAAYTDTNQQVRFAARDAIEKVDPKFLRLIKPLVEPVSSDSAGNMRKSLVKQIAGMSGDEARPFLPVMFHVATKPSGDAAIFSSIAKMAPDDPYVFNGLLYHSRNGDGPKRGQALAALAYVKCEQRAVLPMLLAVAQNVNETMPVRAGALKAIAVVGLGSNEAEKVAAALRGDKMTDVNSAAQYAARVIKEYREKNGASDVLKAPAKK